MTNFLIYKITNNLNGKIYIGKHKTDNLDDGYMGSGTVVKCAVRKYGVENFTKEILFFCTDLETMNNMEEVLVDEAFVARKDTYNMTLGGRGRVHVKHSEETRRKMSEAHKGIPVPWNSYERSEETRQKMSESAKKRPPISEETRRKLSEAHRGKHFSNESKRKDSEAHRGKHFSEETRKKISLSKSGENNPNYGKHRSEEIRRKISNALKGKPKPKLSEEHKQKIRDARKRYFASRIAG